MIPSFRKKCTRQITIVLKRGRVGQNLTCGKKGDQFFQPFFLLKGLPNYLKIKFRR